MSGVHVEILRAIEEAISVQVIPQIRSSLMHKEESIGANKIVHEEPEPRTEETQLRDRNIQCNSNIGSIYSLDRKTPGASHYNKRSEKNLKT